MSINLTYSFDSLVVSSSAARSLTAERQGVTQGSRAFPASSTTSGRRVVPRGQQQSPLSTDPRLGLYEEGAKNAAKPASESLGVWPNPDYSSALDSLCEKIRWASEELKVSSSVEYSIQLCNLIKASADAMQSLKVSQSWFASPLHVQMYQVVCHQKSLCACLINQKWFLFNFCWPFKNAMFDTKYLFFKYSFPPRIMLLFWSQRVMLICSRVLLSTGSYGYFNYRCTCTSWSEFLFHMSQEITECMYMYIGCV